MTYAKLLDPASPERRLDRYELIGELASGGMATVFLARLSGAGGFQRFVAIKRLHPHLSGQMEFVTMFLDEARLAASIHHPNVVPIIEVGESAAGYYVVMEYVEGDALVGVWAREAEKNRRVPPPIALRWVVDALSGLHAAHELRNEDGKLVHLVHRDVSPQNILVGTDGVAKITDFGVAHAAERLASTRSGELKGKLAYMAPEQANGDLVDRRADVFSMAVVLWETLTGQRLFKGETQLQTVNRLLKERIPRVREAEPSVSAAVDDVIAKGLARNRDDRWASAAEMADALERAASPEYPMASYREAAKYMDALVGKEVLEQRAAVKTFLADPLRASLTPRIGARISGTPVSAPTLTAIEDDEATRVRGRGNRSLKWIGLGAAGIAIVGTAAVWSVTRRHDATVVAKPPPSAAMAATTSSEHASSPPPALPSAAPAAASSNERSLAIDALPEADGPKAYAPNGRVVVAGKKKTKDAPEATPGAASPPPKPASEAPPPTAEQPPPPAPTPPPAPPPKPADDDGYKNPYR